MAPAPSLARSRWLPILVVIAALIPRLLIITTPIPVQLDKTLPDDAYYYFLTAQNIARGDGPSVDGLHPSNGWHPLWMLINVGIFGIDWGDPNTPVRASLALGALLDSLTAMVIFLAARRYLGVGAALVGGLAYALNTMPMFQAVNGLETGLASLLVALTWVQTLRLRDNTSTRAFVVWGALFGLCFLARTDTALILVWLGLYVLYRCLRTPSALQLIPGAAVVALVVVAPWLLWNQANFGSALTQVSSIAVPWAIQARFEAANPGEPIWPLGLNVISQPQYWLRGDYLGSPAIFGPMLWIPAATGLWRNRHGTGQPLALMALLLLAGGATLLLVHTLFRWYPRPWYFVVTAHSLALGLALFWHISNARTRLVGLVIGLVIFIISGVFTWQVGLYPWQQTLQYRAALWIGENTPDDALIASMNSGIIGYYSGRTTVNLDGVVNPSAFAAIREYDLLGFMQRTGVDYFADVDYALASEYGLFMGEGYETHLREIAPATDAYPGLGTLRVYAVEG